MKDYLKFLVFIFSLMAVVICINEITTKDKKVDATTETTVVVTSEQTLIENIDVPSNEAIGNELGKRKTVILPKENPDDYFEGEIKVPRVLEPNEEGQYIIIEPRAVLSPKTDEPDELFDKCMETYEKLGIELVDAYMNEDKSVTLIYEEEALEKYISTLEDVYNRRLGDLEHDVSINKEFNNVYLYVNEDTALADIGWDVLILVWHSVLCQIYSGVEYHEWYIDMCIVNTTTDEKILETRLSEESGNFEITEEEWEQLFE